MKRLLFMVEGPADAEFLEAFLPGIGIRPQLCKIRNYGGRSCLLDEIAVELGGPEVRGAVILIDQDDLAKQDEYGDCTELKAVFAAAAGSGAGKPVRVRIACQERESWYLGDVSALQEAFPNTPAASWKKMGAPDNPDAVINPSEKLAGIRGFNHMEAARRMGKILGRKCGSGGYGGNRSASFRCFVKGAREIKRAK